MKKIRLWKQVSAIVLAASLAAGLSACGSSSASTAASTAESKAASAAASTAASAAASAAASTAASTAASSADAGETKTIKIYSNKVEIDEGLKTLTAAYTKEHPNIQFEVESTSNDFYTGLKAKFASDSAPDLFTIQGYSDVMTWQSHLADLSDESWTGDMLDAAKSIIQTDDGKIYTFPLAVEGSAYMYNKDYFEKAGVTTMPTTPDELKAAIQKVKDANVCAYPLIENYAEYYQPANFFLNYAFAAQDDPLALIKQLNEGTADLKNNKYFQEFADFLTLEATLCDNSTTTDFNTQTSNFASGQAAMTFGGNWAQPTLDAVDPNLNCALTPVPVFSDASKNDKIYISGTYWGVNKDSDALPEVKEFLNWLAKDAEGQKGITTTLQLIPGFSTFSADTSAMGALGKDVAKYVEEGKVLGIYSAYYPDGGLETLGNEVCKFIAGKETRDEFLDAIQTEWKSLVG